MRGKINKPVDVRKVGSLSARELQQENLKNYSREYSDAVLADLGIAPARTAIKPVMMYDIDQDEHSPLQQQTTQSGKSDYWGRSVYDNKTATTDEWERLGDIRAENQPWYSKLASGILKGGVTAVTTIAETAGLVYGLAQGTYEAITGENAMTGEDNGSFLHGLWDNPITNALKDINDFAEEQLPNYYTKDEQENPWSHIFSANFIGDKIIKNLGFMVGAYYGGLPVSKLAGKVGVNAVKGAREAALAERAGMAARASNIMKSVEAEGLSSAEYAAKTSRLLKEARLTSEDIAAQFTKASDKVRKMAGFTRTTTQAVGAFTSAVNEGAIEAINNSADWAKNQRALAKEEYENKLQEILFTMGETPEAEDAIIKEREKYEKKLEEIEYGRARMGNADLLLNLPILMASNVYQLGRLYSRGFESTRREMKGMLGTLANHDLRSGRTRKKALASAFLKSQSEGLEEYLQRAASDGAGEAVANSINTFINSGKSGHAKNYADEYITSFAKSAVKNLSDPNAWEEYFIGAFSAALGMPVTGSRAKDADIKIGKKFGISGGLLGNYNEYMAQKKKEDDVANYLNERVQKPEFKKLYQHLKVHGDLDDLMQKALSDGDKKIFEELKFKELFKDINAAASAGRLDEFKAMIGYLDEIDDDEVKDIVRNTSQVESAQSQIEKDKAREKQLVEKILPNSERGQKKQQLLDEKQEKKEQLAGIEVKLQDASREKEDALLKEHDKVSAEINAIDEQLKEYKDVEAITKKEADEAADELVKLQEKLAKPEEYKDKKIGQFVNANGDMTINDEARQYAREVVEKNRDEILDTIDAYLKIRNDIDIETDGRLTDDQIALLTYHKAQILNMDVRSADMAYDLVTFMDKELDINKDLSEFETAKTNAQQKVDEAKNKLEAAKEAKKEKKEIEKLEREVEDAEKAAKKAAFKFAEEQYKIKLYEALTTKKSTSSGERAAYHKGLGEGFFKRLTARLSKEDRYLNADEVQAAMSNPMAVKTLFDMIDKSALSDAEKVKLKMMAIDLFNIAHEKVEYNKALRKMLNDPTLLNDAFKRADDKMTEEEKNNKIEELALQIKDAADNLVELDQMYTEALQADKEIAKAAMKKAIETSEGSTKETLTSYDKGLEFYNAAKGLLIKLQKTQNLDDNVVGTAWSQIDEEWENALIEGTAIPDTFKKYLKDGANALIAAKTNPPAVAAGKVLLDVLKNLDEAVSTAATNKEVHKPDEKKEEGKGKEESKSKKEEEKADKEDAKKVGGMANIRKRAKNRLENEVKKAVTDALKNKSKIVVPESLKKEINKHNNEAPSDDLKIDLNNLIESIVDEYIKDNGETADNEDGSEVDETSAGNFHNESEVASQMKAESERSFRTDVITKYDLYADYRKPYVPVDRRTETNTELQAVQKFLDEYKAYDFLDANYLGYIARESNKPIPVYFIKSTDDSVQAVNPTFIAVKITGEEKDAILEHAFPNGAVKEIPAANAKFITIDGEQYQIIGALSVEKGANEKVKTAHKELEAAINEELGEALTAERNKETGRAEFLISKKFQTKVRSINTGRLEKLENAEDKGNKKVSLHSYLIGDAEHPGSSEYQYADDENPFEFGVVVGNDMANTMPESELYQLPNTEWKGAHNGAIVMYVPKPDGRYYPVRCTRRTVKDWLASNDIDGVHSGESLLEELIAKDGNLGNEYLDTIINHLKILFNAEAAYNDRLVAKYALSKFFIFGKSSPIHVKGKEITIDFGKDKVTTLSEVGEDNQEDMAANIKAFFRALADNNILFTLPASYVQSINGNHVIKSGILEIGLKGFRNFNSNAFIVPINGNGEEVTTKAAAPIRAEGHPNDEEHTYNFGSGDTKYRVNYAERKVEYAEKDGEPSIDEVNAVLAMADIRAGKGNSYSAVEDVIKDVGEQLDPETRKELQDSLRAALADFNNLYFININGELWIYEAPGGDVKERLKKASDPESKARLSALNTAKTKYVSEHMREAIKKSQERKAAGTKGSSAEKIAADLLQRLKQENADIASIVREVWDKMHEVMEDDEAWSLWDEALSLLEKEVDENRREEYSKEYQMIKSWNSLKAVSESESVGDLGIVGNFLVTLMANFAVENILANILDKNVSDIDALNTFEGLVKNFEGVVEYTDLHEEIEDKRKELNRKENQSEASKVFSGTYEEFQKEHAGKNDILGQLAGRGTKALYNALSKWEKECGINILSPENKPKVEKALSQYRKAKDPKSKTAVINKLKHDLGGCK